MREILMETKSGMGEDGDGLSFDYYLLVDELCLGEDLACESYGVKVARTGGGEEAQAPNVTASVGRIDALMDLITRNFVTPTTLRDVVEDWLE